ncbi:MAG: cyanophycinase [Vulcanimicrobiota bacterium]
MSTIRETAHYTYYHRGSDRDVTTPTRGGAALMGGSTDLDEAFRFLAEQGGHGDFLVLRGSGADGYQQYVDEVAEVNSVSTLVLKDAEAAQDPFVLEKVRNAEAVFFAGGDQWNYVGKWKNSPLLVELNRALLRGVPMGGTSAGLAILGERVFTAENGTVDSEAVLQDPHHPAVSLDSDFLKVPGLENLITDSHFSERQRLGRLVTFMARLQDDQELDRVRGLGVDEQTAVLLSAEGQGVVVGEGKAHFVEALQKPERVESGQPLTHRALTLHSLQAGQTFSFSTWTSEQVSPEAISVIEGCLE